MKVLNVIKRNNLLTLHFSDPKNSTGFVQFKRVLPLLKVPKTGMCQSQNQFFLTSVISKLFFVDHKTSVCRFHNQFLPILETGF